MQIAIHDRYIFKKMTFNFFIHLAILFIGFVILDISLRKSPLSISFFSYYGSLFSLKLDRLIALSFLLAVVRTLLDLNRRFELVSLQIAGNSILKITRMILLFAALLSFFNLANFEFLYPKAYDIKDNGQGPADSIRRIILSDGSDLFYNTSKSSSSHLKDLFWLKSEREIWHIKSITNAPPYIAKGIDCFTISNGKVHHQLTLLEDKIDLERGELIPSSNSYQYQKISTLLSLSRDKNEEIVDKRLIFNHLYYKELISLFPLLIGLCMIPIASTYQKVIPSIKIYVTSLFIFILFYFMIRVNTALAESEVISPMSMLIFPLVLLVFCFSRLLKMYPVK